MPQLGAGLWSNFGSGARAGPLDRQTFCVHRAQSRLNRGSKNFKRGAFHCYWAKSAQNLYVDSPSLDLQNATDFGAVPQLCPELWSNYCCGGTRARASGTEHGQSMDRACISLPIIAILPHLGICLGLTPSSLYTNFQLFWPKIRHDIWG